MKRKIIVNGSFLAQPLTGVQRFAIEISRALKSLQPDIQIVAPKNIRDLALAEQLSAKIIGNFTGHLWEQLDLYRYVKREEALLLCLDVRAPILYRSKIVAIHDLNFLSNPHWVSPKFHKFYKWLVENHAKNSLHLLTVSEFSKKEIVKFLNVPEKKISIIYNAVFDHLQMSKKCERVVLDDYILAVSSTDPRKNLDRLTKAFHLADIEDLKLVIVGLPHKQNLTQSMQDERITYLGHVDDAMLISLYQHAKAFVYPSLYEGFGIPPLEAMYYGCPVLASCESSMPEICGDAALYVNPYDQDDIAKGIKRIVHDLTLREKLIALGHQRESLFNWKTSAIALSNTLDHYLS